MSLKYSIFKTLADFLFTDELIQYKKEVKEKLASIYKHELDEKDEKIKSKDKFINNLIKENQSLKIELESIKVEKERKKEVNKTYEYMNVID